MHGYLSADIICSEKRTVFRERSSRKTVSYEEQIMSKDKYPSIFSPQREAIVFIILQIFFATRAIFKIGEYSRIFPSFSWGIFGHVTRLDESRASEKIWWIIMSNNPHDFVSGIIRQYSLRLRRIIVKFKCPQQFCISSQKCNHELFSISSPYYNN